MLIDYFRRKDLLYIYINFFGFFLIFETLTIIAPLYLGKLTGLDSITVSSIFFSIVNVIGTIFPLIGAFLAKKFDRKTIVSFLYIFIACTFAIAGIVNNSYLYILIFILIYAIRSIFNQALNPYIGSLSDVNSDKVFALRDVFLFFGAGVGLTITSFLVNDNLMQSLAIVVPIIAVLIFFITRPFNLKSKQSTHEHNTETKKISFFQLIKDFKRKGRLAIFLLMYFTGYFVSSLYMFLPLIFAQNIDNKSILLVYSISNYIIPFLALVSVKFLEKRNKKKVFLFDHFFDILPICLMIISPDNIAFLFLILLLFSIKDLVSPISMAYFFNCFPDEEGDIAWAIIGSCSNFFSIMSPIIIGLLWKVGLIYVELVVIIFILLSGIMGAKYLPKKPEDSI